MKNMPVLACMKNMLENNKQEKSQAKRVKIRTGKIMNQGAIDKNPFLRNCILKRTDVKEGDRPPRPGSRGQAAGCVGVSSATATQSPRTGPAGHTHLCSSRANRREFQEPSTVNKS